MIDPIHSLAFSIQANRGVYAVLLGSGASRAANIPTGWEITLDLIRKLAVLHGEDCEPDPERWYRERIGREANYSELLDALGRTPAERQQLLRVYLEPDGGEHEDEDKQPTAAHRALATLVGRGFIRVIVTTNFDRLTETALREEGIEPSVLSAPEQVEGALPLIHTQCCVFKVHGDYLDPRIRNTHLELEEYPPEFDHLLDRILDEFGLIVCGWSAEWDGALRKALLRAQSRRFTTYWAVRDDPGDEAKRLFAHRGAQTIRIEDADTLFRNIQENVESIEEFSRPHPLSVEAAVTSLKRYISDNRHRIQLMDLVDGEVARVVEVTTGQTFRAEGMSAPDGGAVTARVRALEAACSTLLAMAGVGGFWAEEEHEAVWRRALARLCRIDWGSGYSLWFELQRYPATLLLYALGIGAVESDRLGFLRRMFEVSVDQRNNETVSAAEALPPSCLFDQSGHVMRLLEGKENHYAPLNDWLHDTMRESLRALVPDDDRYTWDFDRFEILLALACAYRREMTLGRYWAPPGAFAHRHGNRIRIFKEISDSLDDAGDASSFVRTGIFGKTAVDCKTGLSELENFVGLLRWGW